VTDASPARPRIARILNPHGHGPRRLVLQGLLCLALSVLIVDQLAHGLFWPDADARDVLVLGSETCPHSRAVAARLRALGVPFREVDTRRDPIASALAAWAYQSLRVPVVVVGPEVIHGNRADRIDQALARLGWDVGHEAASTETPVAEARAGQRLAGASVRPD